MLTEDRHRQLRVLLLIVLDVCTISAAFSLAYLLRFYWEILLALDEPPATPYFAILTPLIPTWLLIFATYGLYRDRVQGLIDEALRVGSTVAVGMRAFSAEKMLAETIRIYREVMENRPRPGGSEQSSLFREHLRQDSQDRSLRSR